MGRRNMKLCILCFPMEVEAVAKYYIPPSYRLEDGSKPCDTGWMPVCVDCAESVHKHNPQFGLEYYNPENKKQEYGPYEHRWGEKINLVSNPDGTDTYECEKRHKRINIFIAHRIDYGCPIPDDVESGRGRND